MTRYDKPLTLDQIAAIQDKDIDFSDIPELDDNFWQEAEVKFPDLTEQVTLRVKGSVLAYFKASGKGYQTRINQVLESYVRRKESQLSPAIKILKRLQESLEQDPAIQEMKRLQESLEQDPAIQEMKRLQESLEQDPVIQEMKRLQENLEQNPAIQEMKRLQENLEQNPAIQEMKRLQESLEQDPVIQEMKRLQQNTAVPHPHG